MNWVLVALTLATFGTPPGVGYVYPPVVPVGAVTKVQFGGYDWTPDLVLHSLEPGVEIEKLGPPGEFLIPKPPYWFGKKGRSSAVPIPRELPAAIHVPTETAAGLVRWQVTNFGGTSGCANCLVAPGNVVIENRHRDTSQTIKSIPVTIGGRLGTIAEIDQYQFTASNDGIVTVELIARRIGSNFNGVIEVHNSDGSCLADVADTEGRDCELTFSVKAKKNYNIKLFDSDFRGYPAFVYALRLTPGPRVLATRPAFGRPGQSRDVQFIGYGLTSDAAQIEQITRTVDFPDDAQGTFTYHLETPFGSDSIPFALGKVNEIVNPQPTEITTPAAINGSLEEIGGEDRYTLQMTQGNIYRLSVAARVLGSVLDPVLRVLAPDGSEAAKNDDVEGSVDCLLEFTAATEGPHTIVIGDISAAVGTPLSFYRLTVEPAQKNFALSMPQTVNFEAGGKAALAIQLSRFGGYAGEVALEIKGLPMGVTAPANLVIPGDQKELKFELTITEDCAATSSYLQIVGVGDIDGKSVQHMALAGVGGNLCPREPMKQRVATLLLNRTIKPPLTIDWVGKETQHERPRGSTFPAEIEIKREEGYDGEIWLMMASSQSRHRQGIRGPILKVPAGVEQTLYPVYLPEWLETNRTSRMVVLAMAKVIDAQGINRYVMTPSGRLCMILEGSLMKVDGRNAEIEARPGEYFEVPVDILRRPKFTEDVTLELSVPKDVDDLFRSTPVVVPVGETRATIRVLTTADPRLYPEQPLMIHGRALQDGQWLVASQTTVTVVFDDKVASR